MALTGSQKFAVMLCKFSDSSAAEPQERLTRLTWIRRSMRGLRRYSTR
jgi:hypothetical protein